MAVAKAVDRALKAKGELVALARLERSERARQALPFHPMRRRSLLALGLGVPAFAAVRPGEEPCSRKVGVTDAQELQDTAVWLYGLDYQHGGAALWRAAKASAQQGYDMLENGTYGEVVEKRLLKATGRKHSGGARSVTVDAG